MLIKIALLLVFSAFALFLSVDLVLWLAIPRLANILTQLGLALLMTAFGLLLTAGLFIMTKLTLAAFLDYISAKQRLERRLLFIDAKQEQLKSLFYFKTVQINYFSDLKRKRLLRVNNKKHLQSLSKAIHNDLRTLKRHLPKAHYQQLQQIYNQSLKEHNIEALIKLQSEISTLI